MKAAIRTVALLIALAAVPAQAIDTLYYYHNDHLGTPQKMTDENQIVVWDVDYTPFGAAFGTATIENNLRFPGQYYDAESGLHYNYFRDYDPGIGRYIQSDPIGLRGGLNTYAYTYSNPLRYIDPLGLEVSWCCAPIDVSWLPDPAALVLPKHCWLKTDTYESGMAADCPIPGQQCSDKPGADTKTKDHSGQSSSRKGAECTPLKNVDEQCVDEKIKPGQPTGTWHPYNQCQSFSAGVMGQCRYGPNIGPDLPSPFQKQ